MPLALCCANREPKKKNNKFFSFFNIHQFPLSTWTKKQNQLEIPFLKRWNERENYGKYCKWFQILFFPFFISFSLVNSFYDCLSRMWKKEKKCTERCDANVELKKKILLDFCVQRTLTSNGIELFSCSQPGGFFVCMCVIDRDKYGCIHIPIKWFGSSALRSSDKNFASEKWKK